MGILGETKTLNEAAIEIVTRYFNRLIDEDYRFDPTEKSSRADIIADFIRSVKVGQAIYDIAGVSDLLDVRAEILNNSTISAIVDVGITELIFLLGPDNYKQLANDVGQSLILSSISVGMSGTVMRRTNDYAEMFKNNPWLVFVYLVTISWFSENDQVEKK